MAGNFTSSCEIMINDNNTWSNAFILTTTLDFEANVQVSNNSILLNLLKLEMT